MNVDYKKVSLMKNISFVLNNSNIRKYFLYDIFMYLRKDSQDVFGYFFTHARIWKDYFSVYIYRMQKKICVLFILTVFLTSCSNKIYLERAAAYMNASNPEEKTKYMAEGFRSYFAENGKGDGKNREEVIVSLMKWDGPMHPDIPIQKYTRQGDTLTVFFVEQNDFTKLIGYPGWKGSAEFVFDSKKMIKEYVYYPDSTNTSYRPYLKPALTWLQKNKPEELGEVYQNGKLVQNEEAARQWIRLLNEWKKNS